MISTNIHNTYRIHITSQTVKGAAWLTFSFVGEDGAVLYEVAAFKTGFDPELPDIIDPQELARSE